MRSVARQAPLVMRMPSGAAETETPPHSDEDVTIVSWNIGLRGLRQLVDASRGADKVSAKDEHGVSRQLGYGGIEALLDSLGTVVEIVCLQETKLASRSDLDVELACPPGWDSIFSISRAQGKGGYAGTAMFFRVGEKASFRLVAAEEGITGALAANGSVGYYGEMRERFSLARMSELDAEGRALVADFGGFVLVTVYCPAVTSADEEEARIREAYKLDFLAAVEIRYRALLAGGRRVILCGDWNIAPAAIDTARAASALISATFLSNPSRAWLSRQLVDDGEERALLVDVFRRLHPDAKGAYTCWNVAAGCQITNYGSRIDYFLADVQTSEVITRAGSYPDHPGSDHCPVFIALRRSWEGAQLSAFTDAGSNLPPLASSIALTGSGRQGRLDDIFVAAGFDPGGKRPDPRSSYGLEGAQGATPLARGQPSARSAGVKRKAPPSIASFFKPPADASKSAPVRTTPTIETGESGAEGVATASKEMIATTPALEPGETRSEGVATASKETIEAWQRIRLRQQPPKCKGHGETCKVRTVKKPGPNCGRVFFACPRPAGERSAGGDCGFFQWAYDRK